MKILSRLRELERAKNNCAPLILDVLNQPTPDQKESIDQAITSGRRLLVFYDPGNTLWSPGAGLPPWEEPCQH
ncbi:MAG: hypothetical protein Q8L02_06220 [Candidatus Nitrotoga sp.]|nr:hypothetical protein [Candidatus Nitrotoga sp.]